MAGAPSGSTFQNSNPIALLTGAPSGNTTFGISNNNPLAQPGQVLSGQALIQAAHALANAQTQGPLTELARQISQNNLQGQNAQKLTSGYFNQLGTQAQQGVTDENNIANGLNAQLKGIAGNEQNQLGGVAANGVQSLLKYAPQGEGGLAQPALGSLITELARQQGLAAQNEGAFRSAGALQGANYGGLAASNLGSFASRGQEMLGDEGRATQLANEPLTNKVAALRAQEGALFSTDLGKLRQQEITNNITQQGLGIKQQTLQQTIANDNTRNALTARGQNITLNGQQLQQMRADRSYQLDAQKFGAAQAKDAYLRAHSLGPYKPSATQSLPRTTPTGVPTLSVSQQQLRFNQIDTLRGLIQDAQKHGLTEPQIRDMLANGQNPTKVRYDPALVDSAYALDGWGYLTPKQITELNNIGLIVGSRYRRGNAPKPAPGPAAAAGNALGAAGNAIGNAL